MSVSSITQTGIVSASSMIYFLLTPALILWYIYWKISRRNLIKLSENLPGLKGWPIIGNVLDFGGTSTGNFLKYILI